MELFGYLKAVTEDKTDLDFKNDEIRKGYTPYMMNRFISMTEMYIPLVNEINKYDIPKHIHYKYFLSTLPKRKQYFKYIKKSKDLTLDEKKFVAHYFEIGLKEADIYIQQLTEEQLKEIIDIYKYGNNKTVEV
jgi:hypothetical protein